MLYRLLSNVISLSEKDIFNDGCVGEGSIEFHDLGETFVTDNLDVIIGKINKFCRSDDLANLAINSCDENGRVDCQVMTVKPHRFNKVSAKSLTLWKSGEKDLHKNNISFTVETSVDGGLTYERLELPHVAGSYN